MQHQQQHQSNREKCQLDSRAARTPSSPATFLDSPGPWHGRSASPAFVSDQEEAYREHKEPCIDAQRPHKGAKKWTISPLNRGFSSTALDADSTASGNTSENSSTVFFFTSNDSSQFSSTNSTASSSSQCQSDVSDTDVRNRINVSGALGGSPQLSPASIGRSWEEAIATQNIQKVQHLLNCGFNASGKGAHMKKPPLILAVLTGNDDLVKLLLTAGADINCNDNENQTPLHHAAAAGDRNVVKLLLVAGADLYSRTKQGLFPMQLAADGPTHQLLSQRLMSDMENPITRSWMGLPHPPSSLNMGQLDQQFFAGPIAKPQDNVTDLESAAVAMNERRSISDPSIKGPKKSPVFFQGGSFGQTELQDVMPCQLLDLKMSFPSSSNAVQNVSERLLARDAARKESYLKQNWMDKNPFKDMFGKGKQPTEWQNVWLQNIYLERANSQDAMETTTLRNPESRHSGAADGSVREDCEADMCPGKGMKGSPQNSVSVAAVDKLEKQQEVRQTERIQASKHVQETRMCFQSTMDEVFKEQEEFINTSKSMQQKLTDPKGVEKNTDHIGIKETTGFPGAVQSNPEEPGSASSSANPISRQKSDTKHQSMPSNTPQHQEPSSSDMSGSTNAPPSTQLQEEIIQQTPAFLESKGPVECVGTDTAKSLQSNVLSEDGEDRSALHVVQEADTKREDRVNLSSAHEADSCTQVKERKQVKFVPPSEADLSLLRKDWHGAACAGCVGCGNEGCGGDCLPKNTYEKKKQEDEPSILSSKKLFKRVQMKKTKNFDWKRGELLGEGAYGKVFSGLNQSTGELMAVKQLKFHNSNDDEEKTFYLASLEREISLYKEMRHKHIVGYIDMDKDEMSGYLYIFLEYISGGSIQSMLERFGPFSEPLVRVYTRQLLLGLEYLHKNRIVHRDIKGGNVLVDSDGVVKLGDFGASKAFHEATITDACKSIRGSIFWMAPEVIKGDNYGRHADIWSVGCTVIEMLTAMHPWPGRDNTWAAIFQIAKASSGPPIPETASECAKDFLAKCFHLDPKMRPSASQLLDHPFVAKAQDLHQEARSGE